jgi:hypothetical protein
MAARAVFTRTDARTAQRQQDSRPEHGPRWFVKPTGVAADTGFGPASDLVRFSLDLCVPTTHGVAPGSDRFPPG